MRQHQNDVRGELVSLVDYLTGGRCSSTAQGLTAQLHGLVDARGARVAVCNAGVSTETSAPSLVCFETAASHVDGVASG